MKSEKEKYFESTFIWEKRRSAKRDFYEAQREACIAAEYGVKSGFSGNWADEYVNNFNRETTFWRYEDMIRIYADFLLDEISEQETDDRIKKIEYDWLKSDRFIKPMEDFVAGLENALQDDEFGETDLPCPACAEGTVHIARHNTLKNPDDDTGYHCNKCDFTLIMGGWDQAG